MTVGACGQTIDPDKGSFEETGGYGPGLLEPGECVTEGVTGAWGYKHQCNGKFIASIGFTYDETGYELFIPQANYTFFGDGEEPYEQAKVIACCGAYDEEQHEELWPVYAENCMTDFRQQACMSLTAGLKTLIDDGTVPAAYKGKATDVQNWIAARTTECMNELEAADTSASPDILSATWNLPNNGPWAPQVEDVYLKIYFAFIDDLYLPTTPDTCEHLHENDKAVFTDQSGTSFGTIFDVELDEADGNLLGPVYGVGRITGSDDFASLSTSCSDPYCSTARLSIPEVGSVWAIDHMVLYVDGPLVVSNGALYETITDGRIELYKQAFGDIAYVGGTYYYTIPAGDAHFVVVGKSDDDVATLALSNSTDITATYLGGVWSFDGFEIEYVDDSSDTWTLMVSPSEWL